MLENTFNQTSQGFSVPEEARQVLRSIVIDVNGPGTILQDFDTLLEFVGTEGYATTSKYCFLPQGKLGQLNTVMSQPVAHRLKRPQQRSFPHLHGLFLLLRASGMGIETGAPDRRLMLEPKTVNAWRALNPTERYFALLENWLVHGSVEALGERGGWSNNCFSSLFTVYQSFLHRRIQIKNPRFGLLSGIMNQVTVALMELFGWVRLEYGKPEQGEGVKIIAIERLPLGDAMVTNLSVSGLTDRLPIYDDTRLLEPGVLLPVFQPYFSEYQQVLPQTESPFRDGTYLWRVSLGKAWRQIAAPADLCLDDLAMAILDAFDFESDHLYSFEFRQTNGRILRIACPYEEDAAAFTDEVVLGDLSIMEGTSMTMIFDYGDNWKFNVKLEKVSSADEPLEGPRVIAERGKPPAQYQWDEEEEWDEDE